MKKNKMMRLASVLLIAVMISTSAISGTYAKYVTSGKAHDEARVAKWGVTVTATGDSFAQMYKDEQVGNVAIATVVSNADMGGLDGNDKVLAPGTEGNMADVALTGTPEVDVIVTYKATFELTNWFLDANKNDTEDTGEEFYCPIVVVVNRGAADQTFNGREYSNATAFEDALEAYINGYSQSYEANTDLSTVSTDRLDISWSWDFEFGADQAAKDANNVKDTMLGDQAARGVPAWFEFDLTVTVSQVD